MKLSQVWIDPELATELGLAEGGALPQGGRPTIHLEAGPHSIAGLLAGLDYIESKADQSEALGRFVQTVVENAGLLSEGAA